MQCSASAWFISLGARENFGKGKNERQTRKRMRDRLGNRCRREWEREREEGAGENEKREEGARENERERRSVNKAPVHYSFSLGARENE
jgi:hypothetical protein